MLKNVKSISLILLSGTLCFAENIYAETAPIKHNVNFSQQSGKVSGTVEDPFGPVAGASVVVKGTTNGTITDMDGNFTLSGLNNGDVILISFIGYTPTEITYTGQSTLAIEIEEDTQKLDEVVVTALGIKREKKALGYSVSSVKGDELTNAGTPMNAIQGLYGKTSGLQIAQTNSGPTGGMVIKVRNAVSMNDKSTTRPLIVVDGIPIHDENTTLGMDSADGSDHGTGLNDINPEDIASIEILKGAKAAVLYGSEGANGVMLITTKSGSKKGLGIDFGANYSWTKAAFMPKLQNEFGSGQSLGRAALNNISADGYYMATDPTTGQPVEAVWREASFAFGPKLDGRRVLGFDDVYHDYVAYDNNYKDMYRTGHLSNVNFALSNGGDLGSFRLSYNYRDYNSISIGADNKSHSFNFSGDLKANDWVKIRVNSSYSTSKDHNAPYQLEQLITYGVPRELDVNYIKNTYLTDEGYNRYAPDTDYVERYGAARRVSQYYWSQLQNSNDYQRDHFIQSINMDVTFNDKFSWTTLGGMDYTVSNQETKQMLEQSLQMKAAQGFYQIRNIRNTVMYGQTSFNYKQTFNDVWDVSAMVGGAVKQTTYDNQRQYIKETFAIENWFSMNNTTLETGPMTSRDRGDDLLLSVFASAQLAYANQVYLEIQARNDWSSILPPTNNHYFYPGASLSWIFTEAFEIPKMNFGKVRVSWADVGRPGPRYYGNVAFKVENYGGMPTMQLNDDDGSIYLPPADFAPDGAGFPSANLKPERKREYEVGFETAFFRGNRVSLDFSFFHNNTYNQIIQLPVPSSSGVKAVRMNAGDIAQNGIELSINTKPIMTKDWTWELGFNLANYSTKVVKLGKGITQQTLSGGKGNNVAIYATEGGQFGEVYVRPYRTHENGERIVNQSTGVYEYDNTQWKKVGKITPDLIGGVTTGLSWKDFSLNATIDFQFGATMISQANMYLLGTGLSEETLKFRDEARGGLPYYLNTEGERVLLNSHTAAVPSDSHYNFILHDGVITPGVKEDGTPNDKLITAHDYYYNLYWNSSNEISEDKIYKSDYISMRSLSIAYNLPKKFISKYKIQNARINAFANNLFYIYKAIPNVTPESTYGTNSYYEMSTIPAQRSFGIGLNVSF